MINLICAVSNNNIIGKDNKLPWPTIKEDMKRFRKLTTNNIIVMGRKTFESIGNKPLKNRFNIVLTKQLKYSNYDNLMFTDNINHILEIYKNKNIYVIGGNEIYKQFLKYTDLIYLTKLNNNYFGDTEFIKLDDDWTEFINYEFIDKHSKISGEFKVLGKLIKK